MSTAGMTLKNDTQDSSVLVSLLQYRINRKGLSTWSNKKDRQQSMQESTFNFSNILYSSFLRIRRCRLRSRFLGCITPGRLATSFPAKVPPTSSSWITPSLIYSFKKRANLNHLFLSFNYKLLQLLSILWWPTIVHERSARVSIPDLLTRYVL